MFKCGEYNYKICNTNIIIKNGIYTNTLRLKIFKTIKKLVYSAILTNFKKKKFFESTLY